MKESGLSEVLKSTFGRVEKMLQGKNHPQNVSMMLLNEHSMNSIQSNSSNSILKTRTLQVIAEHG